MKPYFTQDAVVGQMTIHHSRNVLGDMKQFHYIPAHADENTGNPDPVEGLCFHRARQDARFPKVEELLERLCNAAVDKARAIEVRP